LPLSSIKSTRKVRDGLQKTAENSCKCRSYIQKTIIKEPGWTGCRTSSYGVNYSKTIGQHLWCRLFFRAIPQAIIRRMIVANHSNNCKVCND